MIWLRRTRVRCGLNLPSVCAKIGGTTSEKRTPAVAVNDPPGAGDRRGTSTTGVVFILPKFPQDHNPYTARTHSED